MVLFDAKPNLGLEKNNKPPSEKLTPTGFFDDGDKRRSLLGFSLTHNP